MSPNPTAAQLTAVLTRQASPNNVCAEAENCILAEPLVGNLPEIFKDINAAIEYAEKNNGGVMPPELSVYIAGMHTGYALRAALETEPPTMEVDAQPIKKETIN